MVMEARGMLEFYTNGNNLTAGRGDGAGNVSTASGADATDVFQSGNGGEGAAPMVLLTMAATVGVLPVAAVAVASLTQRAQAVVEEMVVVVMFLFDLGSQTRINN